jgi:hypothetical protein
MPAYIVSGDPVFPTVEDRDAVAARVNEVSATTTGLFPSARVRGISPGLTLYSYFDPWTGTERPGVRIAFQGSDQQVVSDAGDQMGSEIYAHDTQAGSFGTWTDMGG